VAARGESRERRKIEVIGVVDVNALYRDAPPGPSRPLLVSLERLPQNLSAKLVGSWIEVETPDGTKTKWLVDDMMYRLPVIFLKDATPEDVFARCFVWL
jgi:hypothetical protein